tara:strand:+ start:264 stop:689 length:426 start_codon:yes stop_codon:yes gene_type:complete
VQFYNPTPQGVITPLRGTNEVRRRESDAFRVVYRSDRDIAYTFTARSDGDFGGSLGNGVTVTCWQMPIATKFRLQFWNRDGTQISDTLTSTAGLEGIKAKFNDNVYLSGNFTIRSGVVSNIALVDTGAGMANGELMTGGNS